MPSTHTYRKHTRPYIRTYTHKYNITCTQPHTHIPAARQTNILIHGTEIDTYTQAYTHTYRQTYTHTHIQAHIYTE